MKKEYIIPETLLMEIRLQQLITASDPKPTLNEEEAYQDGEVLSRRRNRNEWEDEEYDDEEDF